MPDVVDVIFFNIQASSRIIDHAWLHASPRRNVFHIVKTTKKYLIKRICAIKDRVIRFNFNATYINKTFDINIVNSLWEIRKIEMYV